MRHKGHIRERSPGSWELRYGLGTDPATGKRRVVTTTVHGKRKDADKALRGFLGAVDTGEHVDPSRMTVGQWLIIWLAAVREEISPKSHERYGDIVNHFLVPELGAMRIQKLAPTDIQKVYTKWATEGRRDGKGGGLSPATRRYIHRVFRAALARACEQQVIARNSADAFRKRLPKIERHEMATLTLEQSVRLLSAVENTYLYWPVLLALSTGMRRGEILALRWKNLDLERRTLRVVESLEQTKAGLRFKPPKTEKVRVVTLPEFAVARLRTLKRDQAETLLKLGVRQTSGTLVCAKPDGAPYQPRGLTHAFSRRVAGISDIPRVRFHDLRHSHATQLLLSGVHPKIAQERLGHSTITTTLDLYSHVTQTMQEDAAARLDAAFQSAISGAA